MKKVYLAMTWHELPRYAAGVYKTRATRRIRRVIIEGVLSLHRRLPVAPSRSQKGTGAICPIRLPQVMTLRRPAAIAVLVLLLALVAQNGSRPPEPIAPGETAGLVSRLVVTGPGQGRRPDFSRPLGAALAPDGHIVVADTGNDRVCVFSPSGRFLFEFGGTGVLKSPKDGGSWRPGRFNFPTDVAVGDDGRLYVADMHNGQIQVFDRTGRFIRAFPDPKKPVGRGSSGRGGGIAVTALAVRGEVLAATDTYQVFVFTTSGELLTQFGRPGTGQSALDHPGGIALGHDGTIYVADSNHARISAFTQHGEVLWTTDSEALAQSPAEGPELSLPRGLAIQGKRLWTTDALDSSLVECTRDGAVTRRVGTRGVRAAQFNFPNDIDVIGQLMLVADRGNNRVQVVQLGVQP